MLIKGGGALKIEILHEIEKLPEEVRAYLYPAELYDFSQGDKRAKVLKKVEQFLEVQLADLSRKDIKGIVFKEVITGLKMGV